MILKKREAIKVSSDAFMSSWLSAVALYFGFKTREHAKCESRSGEVGSPFHTKA